MPRSADLLEWGGEQARRISDRVLPGWVTGYQIEIQTHLLGVVAAFTPWNFPMALAAKKFAGALGAGCSIICKSSEETPSLVLTMAEALLEAGVTPAASAVVLGDADRISKHLLVADSVAKITFTGSIPMGKGPAEDKRIGLRVIFGLADSPWAWRRLLRVNG